MFSKVLVANRGDIALRVVRACRDLGVRTVVVHSTSDADAAPVRLADESVCVGPPRGRDSYQNVPAILEAARMTGADAVHPGYGYLSEDADFAEVCQETGLTFIGPSPRVISALGDKSVARQVMAEEGLPLLPGGLDPCTTIAQGAAVAERIGYPVIIKVALGGGGIGMRVARDALEFNTEFLRARAVAQSQYGSDRLYVERYLERARHVEVQVLCDHHGAAVHLGTRDCTVQRRFQKLVEEAPAPGLAPEVVDEVTALVVRAARAIGYTGVGTFEFLADDDQRLHFMEVNSRIQVEHTVTEMVTGIDLVQQQILVAAGEPLRFRQEDVQLRGHALECRINAEDPMRDFCPTPGLISRYLPPGGPFTRVDSHVEAGTRISPEYDSLLAKLVVWAPDRDGAVRRMARALEEFRIEGQGVCTTLPFHREVMRHETFLKADHTTAWTLRPQAWPTPA